MRYSYHFDFSNLHKSREMGNSSGESGLQARPPLFNNLQAT